MEGGLVVITMVRMSAAAIVIGLLIAHSAFGYQQPTHQVLTEEAAGQSVLATKSSILSLLECSATTPCSFGYVQGLLGQAAIDEDDGKRGVAHFFDAQNNGAPVSTTLTLKTPLQLALCNFYVIDAGFVTTNPCAAGGISVTTLTGQASSENWALSGFGQLDSFYHPDDALLNCQSVPDPDAYCDYNLAKNKLVQALTAPASVQRNIAATNLFFNLGHVLHHIQDQAQPQHVRNDPHCDSDTCKLLTHFFSGLGAPSAYEAYVNGIVPANRARFTQLAIAGPQGPLNVPPTPAFSLPTDFWSTGGGGVSSFGRGLSEFDSYNFLSLGSSPMATASTLTPDPAHPQPSIFAQQVRSIGCSAPNPQPDAVLDQIYLTGSVVDNENAGPASSGAYQSYSGVLLGTLSTAVRVGSFTTDWMVAPNCVVYDQSMYLLVPQAIRYSAWFIDFMFRGSIAASLTTDGALSITNNSQSEPLTSGVFQLYADDGSGNRSSVGSACSLASIPPGVTDSSCSVGPLPYPPPTSGKYLLVYQGAIGQEANQVAFTSVSVPTYWDANADFSISGNPNGPWAYLVNDAPLVNAAQNFGGTPGLVAWWNGLGVPDQVAIIKNETNSAITQGGTRVLVPGLLVMDPESQLAVITFTAPVAGAFNIQGEFTGADKVGNSHAVYIELNGEGLWNSAVISYGGVAAFNLNQTLAVGDVISFNVETGTLGCAYCFLSTGFNATISPQGSSTSGP
jgi:hypothetical protein